MGRRVGAVLIGALVIGAVAITLARVYGGPTVVTQPIAFNHQVHATQAKLDCTTVCHTAAPTNVYAGLPSKDVCFECHDPDQETLDKPELTRLVGYVDLDEDIPWQRVATTAPDVFFSHRRHVTSGQINCARCHPEIAEASRPPGEASLVMGMNDCLDCHQESGADVDCLACHR